MPPTKFSENLICQGFPSTNRELKSQKSSQTCPQLKVSFYPVADVGNILCVLSTYLNQYYPMNQAGLFGSYLGNVLLMWANTITFFTLCMFSTFLYNFLEYVKHWILELSNERQKANSLFILLFDLMQSQQNKRVSKDMFVPVLQHFTMQYLIR